MSRDGSVEFTWAGDHRRFRLGIDELLALQDKTGVGPSALANRLRAGDWKVQDLQETFRIGLIGGGLDGMKARELVDAHIVPGRLASHVMMAFVIVISAIQGDEDDPVGKTEAAPAAQTTAASSRARSTATGRSSASPRRKSGK